METIDAIMRATWIVPVVAILIIVWQMARKKKVGLKHFLKPSLLYNSVATWWSGSKCNDGTVTNNIDEFINDIRTDWRADLKEFLKTLRANWSILLVALMVFGFLYWFYPHSDMAKQEQAQIKSAVISEYLYYNQFGMVPEHVKLRIMEEFNLSERDLDIYHIFRSIE